MARTPVDSVTPQRMEAAIRRYFAACNAADADAIAACFTPEACHYFPAGSPFGVLRGARAIAECWCECVRTLGSWWTVDHVLCDAARREAVIEWTHFKTREGGWLRGDEWYRFSRDGLIEEVRAYYACPAPGPGRHELGGFDYEGRGYPLAPPQEAGARR